MPVFQIEQAHFPTVFLLQAIVHTFLYGFTPFIGRILTWYFNRDMLEGRVLCRTMPVLDIRGDVHHITSL